MNQTVATDCPAEILLSLHMNAEGLAGFMKEHTAITLFREGRLSSCTAAAWLAMPRVVFLQRAMAAGAVLLEDSADDLARETSLLGERAWSAAIPPRSSPWLASANSIWGLSCVGWRGSRRENLAGPHGNRRTTPPTTPQMRSSCPGRKSITAKSG